MSAAPHIEVFHDGDCPVCRWEVALYERFDVHDRVVWTDIAATDDERLPRGKARSELLGVFHVRELGPSGPSETWHVGVDAFARIWRALPGFRHAAFLFSVPGLRQLAEVGYRLFLKWQSWHRVRRGDAESCDRPVRFD
ncbi:MAG: DUF393 domain-containing protein [Litorimonas sp.]